MLVNRKIPSLLSLLGCFLVGAVLCSVAILLYAQSQLAAYLNLVVHNRSREEVAAIVKTLPVVPDLFGGPNFTQSSRVNAACDKFLRGYLIALGGPTQLEAAATIQNEADSLIFDREFALVIDQLNERSRFDESVLNLPYLAEAYQRCAVAHCRRRAEGESLVRQKARYYRLLADQTEALAQLFCRRKKFEIAERAYLDAIVSGSQSTPDRDKLERYYLSYAGFLCERGRWEDAFSFLEKIEELR